MSIYPRSQLITIPNSPSRCFCGSTPDPKPPRLDTPHSCAGPCTRTRACGHPCSLNCHPGPCPPCQITIQLPCYCGHQTMSFRCSHLAPSRAKQAPPMSLSCGRVCDKKLDCGNHRCQSICHDGPCQPCPITHVERCYCGKAEKELRCGEGVKQQSVVRDTEGERKWVGQFACDRVCDRYVNPLVSIWNPKLKQFVEHSTVVFIHVRNHVIPKNPLLLYVRAPLHRFSIVLAESTHYHHRSPSSSLLELNFAGLLARILFPLASLHA